MLIQTLATSMSPYLSDLSGGVQHPGFDISADMTGLRPKHGFNGTWIDHDNNASYGGSANIFALMNTDPTASRSFNAAAVAQILRNEADFAANPAPSNCRTSARSEHYTVSWTKACNNNSKRSSTTRRYTPKRSTTPRSTHTKFVKTFVNTGIGIGGELSGLPNSSRSPQGRLRGPRRPHPGPDMRTATGSRAPRPRPRTQSSHRCPCDPRGTPGQGPSAAAQPLRRQYGWAFDNNGHLLSWGSAKPPRLQDQDSYSDMLTELGGGDVYGAMEDSYRNIQATIK